MFERLLTFVYSWAFKQMGYGPGTALYTVFGAFAG